MKTIAVICMLIDHIGFLFFPEQMLWRLIGRLAMPIFAYGIARGAIYTRSMKDYIRKILMFALISQIPFWWMEKMAYGTSFLSLHFNIGFTFLVALNIISLLQEAEHENKPLTLGKILILAILLISADLLHLDYGSYGILVVLLCYKGIKGQQSMWILCFGYTVLTYLNYLSSGPMFLLQEVGVLAFGIIIMLQDISEKKMGRLFYIFYPVHMIVLCIIKMMLMI